MRLLRSTKVVGVSCPERWRTPTLPSYFSKPELKLSASQHLSSRPQPPEFESWQHGTWSQHHYSTSQSVRTQDPSTRTWNKLQNETVSAAELRTSATARKVRSQQQQERPQISRSQQQQGRPQYHITSQHWDSRPSRLELLCLRRDRIAKSDRERCWLAKWWRILAKRFLLRAQGYKEIKDKEVLAKRSMIAKTPNVVKRAQLAPRNLRIV